jgi:NADH-quinone oxidoreductase subunit C
MSSPAAQHELPNEEKAIVEKLNSLGQKIQILYSRSGRIKVLVQRENLVEVAKYLSAQLNFDHVANITGTDFPKEKQIEVVYHLGSIDGPPPRRMVIGLATKVQIEDPMMPSLLETFPSVIYHEREVAEMLGVVFQGHPNLSRLLLPEDWDDIPPMLKSYRLPGRLEGE